MPADALPRRSTNLTIPNFLSAFRLASVPVFVALFVTGRENAGVALYAVAAWTDWVDGYIARRYDQITELGKILDPLADRVFTAALTIMLTVRGILSPWALVAVIGRDLWLVPMFVVLEKKGMARIPVNRTGKTATAALFSGLSWLAWTETTFPLHELGDEIGVPLLILGIVLYWSAAVIYVIEARKRMRLLRHGTLA